MSPSALGVSAQELVAELLAAHDATEMRPLADRLAAIGGDESIEPLLPLVSDHRPGVSGIVIDVIGKIGTDRAVEALIAMTKDNRHGISAQAMYALGETGNPKAEAFLLREVAMRPAYESITSLARFATDSPDALGALARVAETASDEVKRYAFEALGGLHTTRASAALSALIDSSSVTTARLAMDYIEDIDEPTLAKLTSIAQSGDFELGRSAIGALGRAGEAAGPVLASIATDGVGETRALAVRALGDVNSELAFKTLAQIVETTDGDIGTYALESIAKLDMPESRDVLISVAMSDRSIAAGALHELAALNGEDIDAALVVVAKSDSATSIDALSHLLTREHPDAIAMASSRARTGTDEERYETLELLSRAGTPAAHTALVDVIRDEHGPLKIRALSLLGHESNGDPAASALLRDALHAADPEEAAAAASALGNVGTPEARDALVSALTASDDSVLAATVRALDGYRIDDATAAALARAAESNDAVSGIVMRKLISTGSPHGVRMAETALHGTDTAEAVRAMEVLRESQSPAALKLVEEAVHTGEGEVRSIAVRALSDSRDPRTVDIIASALDDSDPQVRETVAYALRAVGGDKARDALLGLSRSSDASDRIAAVQNLRADSDRIAQQRLGEMLRDPESRVVRYAMSALAGTTKGAADLRAVVLDGGRPYDLRYQAAMTLQRYGELDASTSDWLAAANLAATE